MLNKNSLLWLFMVLLIPVKTFSQFQNQASEINIFLDKWHDAAAIADSVAYFDAIAENGIYIGTDKSEVWSKQAFQVWASPHFKSGKTWKFRGENRHVYFASEGHTAWFDELVVSPKSEFRGSGVLVHTEKGWKIQQYVLSVMVPNDIYREVDNLIKKFEADKMK